LRFYDFYHHPWQKGCGATNRKVEVRFLMAWQKLPRLNTKKLGTTDFHSRIPHATEMWNARWILLISSQHAVPV
jgi:hypothetical protein